MLGYQPDNDWSDAGERPDEDSWATPLILAAGIAGAFLFYDLLGWLFNGGGTISIVRSLIAVHAGKASIDVDADGLRLAVVILFCASFLVICGVRGIKRISKRWSGLSIVALVACMIVFNFAFESDLMVRYMTAHEYRRCPSRDHTVGSGKGEVWFNNYALPGTACA